MSGITMRSPTMSTNAVMIRASSFLNMVLLGLLAQRSRRNCPAYDPRESDDGEEVRDHLDELRWDELIALKLNLKRLRCGEEQTRECCTNRIPTSEDDRGDGDESAAGGHLIGELMLIECKKNSAECRENS